MPESPVTPEEIVLRRVPNGPLNVAVENGALIIATSAFNCSARKPSVNREKLRPTAKDSQNNPSDGVLALVAADICSLVIARTGPTAVNGETYQISIQPRPIYKDNGEGEAENLSHAQVEADPPFPNSNQFHKLKERLAYLANERGKWRIEPSFN